MNENRKLYENAEINKIGIKRCSGIKQGICQHNCNECESFDYKYPPFTAEKQLELIKWLGEWDYTVRIDFHENEWGIATENNSGYFQDNLSDALASIINNLWQALTEKEQQQIKEILQ